MSNNELDQPLHEIREELEFARALTALMMAIKLDFSETEGNRAQYRLKARNDKITEELHRLAS
jgi:hypothetical protein